MNKVFILLSVILLVNSKVCDFKREFLYQGRCIPKNLLHRTQEQHTSRLPHKDSTVANTKINCENQSPLPTTLEFCREEDCEETFKTIQGPMHTNRIITLKHLNLSENPVYIQNPVIIIKGEDYKIKYQEQELILFETHTNYNVYQIRVPFVAKNVQIQVVVDLNDTGKGTEAYTLVAAIPECHDADIEEVQIPSISVEATGFKTNLGELDDLLKFINETYDMSAETLEDLAESIFDEVKGFDLDDIINLNMDDPLSQDSKIQKSEPLEETDELEDTKFSSKLTSQNENELLEPPQAKTMTVEGINSNLEESAELEFQRNCNKETHFIYHGACIQKKCLFNKLSRVQLSTRTTYTEDSSKLIGSLVYQVTASGESDQKAYHVKIMYGDTESNQILSDPEHCVDYRIFQTQNQYKIDATRLNIPKDNKNLQPTWPISNYSFNSASSAGLITFELSDQDLIDHNCVVFKGSKKIAYECFFEMGFLVKRVTQISYYFSIKVVKSLETHEVLILEMQLDNANRRL